jgi:hypothetical protein
VYGRIEELVSAHSSKACHLELNLRENFDDYLDSLLVLGLEFVDRIEINLAVEGDCDLDFFPSKVGWK